MNRTHLNLVLLAAVAGLGAVVYFTKQDTPKGTPLTALAADAVDSIIVEHPGAAPIKLAKRDGGWQLLEPVQAAADPLEVATLVNLATQETQRQLKLAEIDAGELKLEPPQFTVQLNQQKLEFGDLDPLESRRYVRVGDQVALIDDPPATAVDADYSDLLAKALLPANAEIARIEVPGLSVGRAADGKTWVATPASAEASGDALNRFVEAWRGARAMWNAAMPADGGHGQPIAITLKSGERVQLTLVATDPQLILDRPAQKLRYTLSKADAQTLLRLAPPAKAEALPAPAAATKP